MGGCPARCAMALSAASCENEHGERPDGFRLQDQLTLSSGVHTKSLPAALIFFQHACSLSVETLASFASPPPPNGLTLPRSHHKGFAARPVKEMPVEADAGGSMGV